MERLGTRVSELYYKMARKRPLTPDSTETSLKRCLTTFDITLLGVGHMVGAGIYVLTGSVTRDIAGPAIIISFLVAAGVFLLAALCFAEFASRLPRSGSTYAYTYITVGEFSAFLVGWNMVLDQLVGTAATARAWSGYVDSLARGAIHNATSGGLSGSSSHHSAWADQLDFLAAGVVILFALLQAIGARCSTNINSLFSLVNVAVILFVSTYGLRFADFSNWNSFTPYGVSGVLSGASSCFFAYAGLDSMAIAAEEAKDPGYSVPRATFYATGIVTLGYLMISIALTLMVPYNMVSINAALTDAFAYHGVEWAQYLVSVLSLAGLSSVLYGYMNTVPRYMYNMASDGLVFRVFSRVSKRTQVPVLNTFMLGGLAAFLALTMDISRLVEYLAMGTLIGYSIVALAVLQLRYQPTLLNSDGTETTDCIGGELKESCHFLDPFISRLPYAAVPTGAIYTFTLTSFLLSYLIAHTDDLGSAVVVIVILIFSFIMTSCCAALFAFEQTEPRSFAVPFCPIVPLLSIGCNMVLLSYLRSSTFLGFFSWVMAGLLMYFCYGIRHSNADEAWRARPLSEGDSVPQWYGSGQGGPTPPPAAPQVLSSPLQNPPSTPQYPPSTPHYPPSTPQHHPYPSSSGEPHSDEEPRRVSAGSVWDRSTVERQPPRPYIERDDSLPMSTDSSWRAPTPSPLESETETEDFRLDGADVRPGLRRQSVADTDSLPSLTYDELYRTTY